MTSKAFFAGILVLVSTSSITGVAHWSTARGSATAPIGQGVSGETLKVGDAVTMDFVRIPLGEFIMGCSNGDTVCYGNEKPAHRVRITKGFEIGKYEVTQAQWQSVMGSNPSEFKGAD